MKRVEVSRETSAKGTPRCPWTIGYAPPYTPWVYPPCICTTVTPWVYPTLCICLPMYTLGYPTPVYMPPYVHLEVYTTLCTCLPMYTLRYTPLRDSREPHIPGFNVKRLPKASYHGFLTLKEAPESLISQALTLKEAPGSLSGPFLTVTRLPRASQDRS